MRMNSSSDPRRPLPSRWLVCALVVCAAALPSCRSRTASAPADADAAALKSDPVPIVTRLSVRDGTPANLKPVSIPREELETLVTQALSGAGLERGKRVKTDPAAWTVSIRAELVYGLTRGEGLLAQAEPSKARAWVRYAIKVRPPESAERMPLLAEGIRETDFEGDEARLPEVLRRVLGDATQAMAKSARAQISAVMLDVPRLIAQLAHADPTIRHATVSRLAMLRAKEAVPALAGRLKTEKEREILLRVIGALAEIRGPEAIRGLIAAADPNDREVLRGVVYALSAIGGDRVDDFLDVLGTHDSPDIREMVEDARQRVGRRRRGDAKPSPSPGPQPPKPAGSEAP